MTEQPTDVVPLTDCRTEFEAETIAAALREQGMTARVLGGMVAGGRYLDPVTKASVVVLRKDLPAARNALRAIKAESVDIDWAAEDLGPPENPPLRLVGGAPVNVGGGPADPEARNHATAFAVTAVLIGLLVLAMSVGVPPPIQMVLGAMVVVSLVSTVFAMLRGPPEASGDE